MPAIKPQKALVQQQTEKNPSMDCQSLTELRERLRQDKTSISNVFLVNV
jgi:hypothetical protein